MKNPSYLLFLALCIGIVLTFKISNIGAYSPTDSRTWALYSGLAYCPKKCLEAWNCQAGKQLTNFGQVTHINNVLTLASAFVGYEKSKNLIIISWRGSSNIQNWIEDFNFQKTSYECKGCEIHAGFLSDYKIVEEKLNQKIQNLTSKYPTANIVATGHSLGGALAQITGIRLKNKFNRNIEVHNFGCPRIGNAALAKYVDVKVDTLYRVVHHKDIVPHLPPEAFEYHHSAFEVFWDEKFENFKICNDSGQDKSCSNQYAPDYSASDHDFYFMPLSSLKC